MLDPGPNSPTGTYTLVRLDGASLPAPIASGVTAAVDRAEKHSHYTLTQTDSAAGAATTSAIGTWSVTDNALQLVPTAAVCSSASCSGQHFMEYRGHQNVYARH